ncbi:MAG: response regulator [bacterium]|nr:response regulator [bacterium]
MDVTSTYGEGTEFTVEISANLQQVEKIRCTSALQEIGETNIDKKKGNKILIVDDNPVNMELIKEQFAKTGFKNLLSASNGKEAIELALQHKPDLTLMDIQMPLMNGNEAIAHLKEKGFNEPIIALSAYAMKEDIDNSMKAGAAGYITKPIDFEKFFPRIAAFLKEKEPLSTPSTTSTMSTSSTPSTPSTPSTTSTTSTMSTMSTPTANPERNTRYIIKDSISTRIKGIFLQDVKDKIQVIEKILQEGKLEEEERNRIKSIAHGYKGNAGYFELRELAKISMELDQSIKENAPDHMIITKSKSLNRILLDICNDNKQE